MQIFFFLLVLLIQQIYGAHWYEQKYCYTKISNKYFANKINANYRYIYHQWAPTFSITSRKLTELRMKDLKLWKALLGMKMISFEAPPSCSVARHAFLLFRRQLNTNSSDSASQWTASWLSWWHSEDMTSSKLSIRMLRYRRDWSRKLRGKKEKERVKERERVSEREWEGENYASSPTLVYLLISLFFSDDTPQLQTVGLCLNDHMTILTTPLSMLDTEVMDHTKPLPSVITKVCALQAEYIAVEQVAHTSNEILTPERWLYHGWQVAAMLQTRMKFEHDVEDVRNRGSLILAASALRWFSF